MYYYFNPTRSLRGGQGRGSINITIIIIINILIFSTIIIIDITTIVGSLSSHVKSLSLQVIISMSTNIGLNMHHLSTVMWVLDANLDILLMLCWPLSVWIQCEHNPTPTPDPDLSSKQTTPTPTAVFILLSTCWITHNIFAMKNYSRLINHPNQGPWRW